MALAGALLLPGRSRADVRGPAVASRDVSYGWGVIPVTVRIGATTWTTSLFPKGGGYLVPLKDRVRAAEGIASARRDSINVQLDYLRQMLATLGGPGVAEQFLETGVGSTARRGIAGRRRRCCRRQREGPGQRKPPTTSSRLTGTKLCRTRNRPLSQSTDESSRRSAARPPGPAHRPRPAASAPRG